jgi:hypothetical protein
MNQHFLSLIILLLLNACINIEVGEVYKLPEPKREGGMPLYEALNLRKSSRIFDNSIKPTPEIISQALWSCYGVREGIYRVVPAAKTWYTFIIYLFLETGVYKYNPEEHSLTKLFDGDHREVTGTQTAVVTKAAMNFVFVADLNMKGRINEDKNLRRHAAKIDIGHITMALSLFASANNMKGVVRGEYNEGAIYKFLNLNKDDYYLTLAFSLGY